MGLWKLGDHSNLSGWHVNLKKLPLSLFTCPICKMMFCDIKNRKNHELCHELPTFTKEKSTEMLSKSDIPVSELITTNEQQEFLFNVKLVKVSPDKQDAIDRLAHRNHLVDAFKMFGNSIGKFNCQHCTYEVKLDCS